MLIFIIISETSSAEDRNSASTRSGFTAWCRDSPLAITVCVHSKLAAWDGTAQSVQRIATAWMVRGSNPDGDKIFCTRPDRPWGPPNLLYKGYKVYFLGLKYWRRGVQHPTQSNAEVKGRVETHTHTHTHTVGLHCRAKSSLSLRDFYLTRHPRQKGDHSNPRSQPARGRTLAGIRDHELRSAAIDNKQ